MNLYSKIANVVVNWKLRSSDKTSLIALETINDQGHECMA